MAASYKLCPNPVPSFMFFVPIFFQFSIPNTRSRQLQEALGISWGLRYWWILELRSLRMEETVASLIHLAIFDDNLQSRIPCGTKQKR